ncbi:MAG: MYG1 family protein [Simkaniaceae bacterium]
MQKRQCGTHDGTFHADEVTAVAMLILFDLIDEEAVIRTRDKALLDECEYVCDVGGIYEVQMKRFDHHQSDYQAYLSSAGMILSYLKEKAIISPDLYQFLNRSLIMGIDAVDNGQVTPSIGHCSFSGVISNFVPVSHESSRSDMDKAFFEAVTFVKGHLSRLMQRYHYIKSCRSCVEKAMKEGKDLLIFDRPMPWMESFFELGGEEHPASFLIMPTGENWKLRGIPPSLRDRMNVRIPLPVKWAGLLDDELEKACQIKGGIFCHKGRFISVWKTKEAAIEAYKKATHMSTTHD